MSYLPLNYDKLNKIENSYIPSMVKNRNNLVYAFWERSLFQRACSTLIINVPETWKGNIKDFLYYCLFRFGFISVFETPEFGKVFNPCTLKGMDFYYQPTDCIISNPALEEDLELKIGEKCELLKLTPDYMGIWDIIGYYAEKMAILDNAINLSIINNKFAYLLGAKTKAVAEALKKIFDKVNRGEPAVFYDTKIQDDPATKTEPFQYIERKSLKENYITDLQLRDMQTLLNNFDAEVGIPTIPYQKKERMVTSEAESREIDSTSRSVIWYDTLKNSMTEVNAMFPDLKLSVELRYKGDEKKDEHSNDNPDRTV